MIGRPILCGISIKKDFPARKLSCSYGSSWFQIFFLQVEIQLVLFQILTVKSLMSDSREVELLKVMAESQVAESEPPKVIPVSENEQF